MTVHSLYCYSNPTESILFPFFPAIWYIRSWTLQWVSLFIPFDCRCGSVLPQMDRIPEWCMCETTWVHLAFMTDSVTGNERGNWQGNREDRRDSEVLFGCWEEWEEGKGQTKGVLIVALWYQLRKKKSHKSKHHKSHKEKKEKEQKKWPTMSHVCWIGEVICWSKHRDENS